MSVWNMYSIISPSLHFSAYCDCNIAAIGDFSPYQPLYSLLRLNSYYPNGHHMFLKAHPDTLGMKTKSKFRVPLWERGKKSSFKAKPPSDKVGDLKGTEAIDIEEPLKDHTRTTESLNVTSVSSKKVQNRWFNDAWLSSLSDETGNYPILCRVEQTYAEFP